MATIAKPRTSQNNVKDDFFEEQPNKIVEAPKNTAPSGGMGKAKKTISDDTLKNKEGLYDEPKEQDFLSADTDEPSGTGTDTEPVVEGGQVVGEGDIKVISEVEKQEEERRIKFSIEKKKLINDGADHILSCLEPQYAHEFRMACAEFQCQNIGVYILAILNRLSKESDFNNPDFEPEWERGVVGFTDELYCEYCNKKIENSRRKQKYCSNLCAKYDRERNDTGIIHPDETIYEDETEEDRERKQYEEQRVREGDND